MAEASAWIRQGELSRLRVDAYGNVLRRARRMFMATGGIEMRTLARELGVGRATLYRWTEGREALLSEVILSLGVANLLRAAGEIGHPPGPERLCLVHDLHLRRILHNTAMRTFVRSEPEVARRVLLDANGTVHVGITEALTRYILEQEEESGWRAPLAPEALGATLSRVSEVFLYSDLISHAPPDVATPDAVLRLMLGVPPRRRPKERCR